MRSVRKYWIKLGVSYVFTVAFTVFCMMYLTNRYTDLQLYGGVSDLQEQNNLVGARFMQNAPDFPDGLRGDIAVPIQRTNENNQTIMIRPVRKSDLDPQPVKWPFKEAATALGLKEIPASRPPHCILLGFGKCGTSALLEFLDLHPKIVILDWEPDYFCERMYQKYDLRWYVGRMPPSFSDQITIEKSPCYIAEHASHLRMHAMNSSLKVMTILRDPITRLLSEYARYCAMETYWGRQPVTFEARVFNAKTQEFNHKQLLNVGDYSLPFERLLKVFPRNQILIVDGDKLVTDPLSQTKVVEDFLQLKHEITDKDIYFDQQKGFYCMKLKNSEETKCLAKGKGRKHIELDPVLKAKLIEYLKPYSEKLFKLVGQRFDWLL